MGRKFRAERARRARANCYDIEFNSRPPGCLGRYPGSPRSPAAVHGAPALGRSRRSPDRPQIAPLPDRRRPSICANRPGAVALKTTPPRPRSLRPAEACALIARPRPDTATRSRGPRIKGTQHGFRPVRDRRRLGGRALRAHRGRPRCPRRHRRGPFLGRYLRQHRLRAEETPGPGRRIRRLGRRRRRLRLVDPQRPARLDRPARRQGPRDRPPQRHLPPPARYRRRHHLRRPRPARRPAHARRRRGESHRRTHRRRHRRPPHQARHPGRRARHRLRRRLLPPAHAEARGDPGQRLYRGRVRRHLRRPRRRGGPRLPPAPAAARLRPRPARSPGRSPRRRRHRAASQAASRNGSTRTAPAAA